MPYTFVYQKLKQEHTFAPVAKQQTRTMRFFCKFVAGVLSVAMRLAYGTYGGAQRK